LFLESAVRIRGPSKVYVRDGQEGRKVRLNFCPECGTTVYAKPDLRPGLIVIYVGAFADPNFPPPTRSIWEHSQHPWVTFTQELEHFSLAATSFQTEALPDRAFARRPEEQHYDAGPAVSSLARCATVSSNWLIIRAIRSARGSFAQSSRAIRLRSIKTCSTDRVCTWSIVALIGDFGHASRKVSHSYQKMKIPPG
jgi:hypothetical protein